MAWIESHEELGQHPKTKRLARRLSVSLPAAVGHLHFLWWWSLKYAQDGDLSPYENEEIADAAMWVGDPDTFVEAVAFAGFLDGKQLHDWNDYAGRLIEQRVKNKERMRKSRSQHKQERAEHVQHTFDARTGATVPNLTVPNQTEQNNNNTRTHTRESPPKENAAEAAAAAVAVGSPTDDYDEVQAVMCQKTGNPNYRLVGNEYHIAEGLVKSGIPFPVILTGIDEAFKNFKPKYPGDRIRSLAYCAPVVEQSWHLKSQQKTGGEDDGAHRRDPEWQQLEDKFFS